MQIVLIKTEKLYKYSFPNNNVNTFWIKDLDESNNERDLISISRKNDGWVLVSNDVCFLESKVKMEVLKKDTFYSLRINENGVLKVAFLYVHKENDESFTSYNITQDGEYSIGSSSNQNIILQSNLVAPTHAVLVKSGKNFVIKSIDSKLGIYVNDNKVSTKKLESGDRVFIFGYTIIVLDTYIIINGRFSINSETDSTSIIT